MNRAERTERIKTLGSVALRLARSTRLQGYIELGGDRFAVYDFAHNKIAVGYLRSMDADVPSKLEFRYLGTKVLAIEWIDRQITKSTFKPGRWEEMLRKCAALMI